MNKYKPSERKVDLYDIGDGLTLMNIVIKNEAGKTKAVHTYIGYEGNGFACVAHSEGLDQPGVIYNYSSHVRMLNAKLIRYNPCFFRKFS
ncbi:MAG: hypothetical protein IJU77_04995 [Butyrivibrio sp.]|nr:hypothetical protein [Butyrivibrio sp.]